MTASARHHLIAIALACASTWAAAQSAGGPPQRPMDPVQRQEMMAKRQAELKAKLEITPAQEGAWAQWTRAMAPPADLAGKGPEERRRMHDEMAKLTTPERMERMNAMKAQRDAEVARRMEATKAFYGVLSPQQQQVFDENARRFAQGRPGGHPGHGGHKASQGG